MLACAATRRAMPSSWAGDLLQCPIWGFELDAGDQTDQPILALRPSSPVYGSVPWSSVETRA
jgi:hypothetical protein